MGTEFVKYIFDKTGGEIPVIDSSGIFKGAEANQNSPAGASLVHW